MFLFPILMYSQEDMALLNFADSSRTRNSIEDLKVEKDELAEKEKEEKKTLELYGDVRFRGEQDWNSRTFIGVLRPDRFRLRVRMRVGFTFNWSKQISIGARIRSGVNESLQSPHNNLGHREFTGFPLNIDKVYISGKHDHFWWWAGKNSFPFWKQNELFWDDDVTPEGVAIGGKFNANKSVEIKPTAAYFITNTGIGNFDPRDPTNGMIDGYMLSGQLELGVKLNNDHKITAASGFYALRDINNVPTTDFFFLRERFKLDYTFIVSGLKIEFNTKMGYTLKSNNYPGSIHVQTNSKLDKVWIYDYHFGWLRITEEQLKGLDYPDTREDALNKLFNKE